MDALDEVADETDALLELTDELAILLAVDDTTVHIGTVIVSVSVVIVPPKTSPIPVHTVLAPTVMPAASMTTPLKVVLAARVVAPPGVQKTLHADTPTSDTIAPAVDVSAPPGLKMYVPLPLSVSGPPMSIAPALQYTPGV